MLTSLPSALCKKVNGYSTFSNVTLKNKELQIVCGGICFASSLAYPMSYLEVECHIKPFSYQKIGSDHLSGSGPWWDPAAVKGSK